MDYQTHLNGDAETRSGLRSSLAGLAHDALTLAELQVRLLTVDLRDARRTTGSALAGLLAGGVLALGAVPLLLLGAAHALIQFLAWPTAAAYAAVGAVAAAFAASLIWFGWKAVVHALTTVKRSRSEFTETLRWLKSSLKYGASDDRASRPPNEVRAWRS